MFNSTKRTRAILVVSFVLIIALAGGFGYYYSVSSSALSSNSSTITSLSGQISSLQGQVQSIQANLTKSQGEVQAIQANLTKSQDLAQAKDSITFVAWLASSTDAGNSFQVKISNNNPFDVTLAQLTLNVVNSEGTQIASNTIAPQIVVAAGASVTTTIMIAPRTSGAGTTVNAIISTPYGQITF